MVTNRHISGLVILARDAVCVLIWTLMLQSFQPGDFLIFQVESGFGLLRVLAVDDGTDDAVWHLAAFEDLFLDVEMAEAALKNADRLTVSQPHLALTNRAFESTQVSKLDHADLTKNELSGLEKWRTSDGEVSDRSIRLLLGLR